MSIKGYKVFNSDWTCSPCGKPFQYEVGGTYEKDEKPIVCRQGFHFCEKAVDCFNYRYSFDPSNKVAEVLALGEVATDGTKSCTNKIKIVREISWVELLKLASTGKGCAGHHNSDSYNGGHYNSYYGNSDNSCGGHCNAFDTSPLFYYFLNCYLSLHSPIIPVKQ